MNKKESLAESNSIKFFTGAMGFILFPIWFPVLLAYVIIRVSIMLLIDFGDGILNGFEDEGDERDFI